MPPSPANNSVPPTMLADFLRTVQNLLAAQGIENPALDVRLLAMHALGLTRTQIMTEATRVLTSDEQQRIHTLIQRRAAHEPVGRIIGNREFWGLSFGLNEATLEPRPDSETLIETVIKLRPVSPLERHSRPVSGYGAGSSGNPSSAIDAERELQKMDPRLRGDDDSIGQNCFFPRILDLGTGTGCLLLALLHTYPQATGLGIDLAPRAVEQARMNAEALGLSTRAKFRVGSWLDDVREKFDIIISNPPYIRHDDLAQLMPDVRNHDPMLALDGGADGIAPYRHLIPQLCDFLNPNGIVVLEVGYDQAAEVSTLLTTAGFPRVSIRKDLGGVERCVAGEI